jgi:3-hydroxy-9,10-secoandrosta-1,3,5(10)-triene-9,17-dione monooxygenase reductase component
MTATDQQRADLLALRGALGSFATGVTIVTTRVEDADVGLTANSFSSVSLDPPMLLWSLAKTSSSHEAFMAAGHFAVHVLSVDQEHLSRRFASKDVDRFAGLPLERGPGDVPLLTGCAARFSCRSAFHYEGGDHTIFVGEIVGFDHTPTPPLVFHAGKYALAAPRAEPLGAADPARVPPTGFAEDLLGYLMGRAHHQLYDRMRSELAELGLGEREHFTLSVLGISDRRTLDEINAFTAYTGVTLTREAAADLESRGLVRCEPAEGGPRLSLTDAGQQALLRLVAAAKAIEVDALADLSEEEGRLLRHLLKRVIRTTDPGIPDLWASRQERS